MELTIVVCDHCKVRHEIDPQRDSHGHLHASRIPRGWYALSLTQAMGEEEEPSTPQSEMSDAFRQTAVAQFDAMRTAMADPALSLEEGKKIMESVTLAFESLGVTHRRYPGHGEHVPVREMHGVYCPKCKPKITTQQGEPLNCAEPTEIYGTIIAS